MKIIWNVGSRKEAGLAVVAASVLCSNGMNVMFATALRETVEFLREGGWSVTYAGDSEISAIPVNMTDVVRLDSEYPEPGIRFLAYSEARARRSDDIEAFYTETAQYLSFWHGLLKRESPDALLCWQSASLFTRAPISVCRALGIPALSLINGPSLGRVTIADQGEREIWSELLDALKHTDSFELSKSQRALVDDHISEITEVNGSFKPRKIQWLPDKNAIKTRLRALISTNDDNGDLQLAKAQLLQYFEHMSWKIRMSLGLLSYSWLESSDRYVYFPMQNTSDVKLTGRNPIYADQITLAEQVALSMRPGMVLYVREHPNHPGMYDKARLRRLLRHPFVKLIHPYESNIELIKRAAVVVCVNSTAAWESYVNRVPLVLVGHPFVRASRLVFGVDGLNDLSAAIRRAADDGPRLYRDHEDEWRWFIFKALSTCPPGHSFGYKTIFGSVPTQDLAENGAKVGNALLAKLRRLPLGMAATE